MKGPRLPFKRFVSSLAGIFHLLLLNWTQVQVQVLLRPTVSRPVRLGVILIFFVWRLLFFLLHVGCPLCREDGSVICSAITHRLESRRAHNHILLSHLRLPQPGGPGPCYLHPPGIGFTCTFKFKLYCDRRSICQFVLVSGPIYDQILIFFLHVGHPLW
jgi:hypothetical protein